MTRRHFLKLSALGTVTSLFCTGKPSHPNIVLVNVDDLGWADVGCFGSEYYETPHIDRLAKQGMKFTHAYASAALCSPTRAAIMTGQYPARIGITDWLRAEHQKDQVLPHKKGWPDGYGAAPEHEWLTPDMPEGLATEFVTIAERLKTKGYATCHIGKWHLGPPACYPEKQGFDLNIGGCDMGEPPSYFDPYYRPADLYWPEPEIKEIPTLPPRHKGEYLTDREADEAVAFIEQHKDQPFFLNMCHYAVHFPIQAKEKMIEKYRQKSPGKHQYVPDYAAMVESVDQAVGRLIQTLERLDLYHNTLFVFTSDNGGLIWERVATSNYPLRAGKGTPYEGGIRIPQIVCWPGQTKAGSVCEQPVASIDFFPTFCEAAGIRNDHSQIVDGQSLVPVLKGGVLERDSLFWHYPHYRGDQPPFSIVRYKEEKLIKYYDGKIEYFNLATDLSEQNNLADRFPERLEFLLARLEHHLQNVGAKLPLLKSDY